MHQIGVGVLGPVFRAYEPDGDRLVAVKAFYLDLTPEQSRTVADGLQGIARAGGSHPALVTPLRAGLSDDIPYLAAEYVAAESLDVAIRHYAPAAVETALPLVVQLADALDTAHACGLTHGALHLRDVFVTPELARITGFGVVPALERVGVRGPLRRPYTAPEQTSSGTWGPAADRFALAAIIYELLTGRRVSGTGEQVTETMARVSGARDATRLTRLFASALAVKPTDRPGSARLFADQLADAVGWTGAEVVREALAALQITTRTAGPETVNWADAEEPAEGSNAGDEVADGAADDEEDRRHGVPAATVAVAQTEGVGMANRNRPEGTPTPELDWSERSLDHGEARELRQPRAYEPRPVGPPPGFERPVEPEPDAPQLDRMDDVDTAWQPEQTLGHALDAAADRALDDALGDSPSAGDSRHPARPPVSESWDLDLSEVLDDAARPVRAPGYREVASPPVSASLGESFFDDIAAPEPAHAGRAGLADVAGPYDGEDDDDQVAQPRRARVEDERLDAESPDTQAAGVYEPISFNDLSARLGDDALDAEDPDDADEYEEDDGHRAAHAPIRSGRGTETPGAASLPWGPDEDYDYEDDPGDDEYDEGVAAGAGWAPTARRLPVVPLVLMVVAVIAGAFAIGYGWLSAAGEDSSADARMVAGLEAPEMVAAPGTPDDGAGREYSEATIADSPPPVVMPLSEPTEPPPASTPAEPEVLTPIAARPRPAPAPVANDGRLLVRSTPPGAQVAVNGELRGTTPLALADLRYDAYDVTFTFEGYETQDRRLTISADDPIVAVDARLTPVAVPANAPLEVGSIFVDTRPPGVQVWLDQRLVGETPMLIPDVAAGSHYLEFKSDGYREWATTVQVGSNTQADVTASLAPAR